jgi:hypothetical protein
MPVKQVPGATLRHPPPGALPGPKDQLGYLGSSNCRQNAFLCRFGGQCGPHLPAYPGRGWMKFPPTLPVRTGGILASRPIQYRPLSMVFRTLRINSFLKPSPRVGCAAPNRLFVEYGINFGDTGKQFFFFGLQCGLVIFYRHTTINLNPFAFTLCDFGGKLIPIFALRPGIIFFFPLADQPTRHALSAGFPCNFGIPFGSFAIKLHRSAVPACPFCLCPSHNILLIWLWAFARCLMIIYIMIIMMSRKKCTKYQKKYNYFIRGYNY